MRILAQTRETLHPPARRRGLVPLLGLAAVLSAPAGAEAAEGQIECLVTENGAATNGTVVLEQTGRESVRGGCGKPLKVSEGRWRATVRPAGVLDNPSLEIDVTVKAGVSTPIRADFPTGVLEVRIVSSRGSMASVTVNRGSTRIGTLGAGVPARLSAGDYEIVILSSGEERRYALELGAGQKRVIRAEF